MDWVALDWRKLYLPFSTSFERLPYAARAMGADVIRRCDREGRIVRVTEVTLASHLSQVTNVTEVTGPSHALALVSQLVAELAFHLRAHAGEEAWLEMAVQKLLDDKYLVVEEGWLKIRNYAEAQKSSSSERMARKRQRDTSVTNVTSDKCDGSDAGVTFVTSDECDEEERRGEEKDQITAPPVAAPRSTKAPPNRGTRLPDGWAPAPGVGKTAKLIAEFSLDPAFVQLTFDDFCDYWRAVPGVKGTKLDWDATWRNWLRSTASKRRIGPQSGTMKVADPAERMRQRSNRIQEEIMGNLSR